MGLQKKLLIVTLIPLLIIFAMVFVLTEVMVRRGLVDSTKDLAISLADSAANELDTAFTSNYTALSRLAGNIATLYQEHNDNFSREMTFSMLRSTLYNSNIDGGTVYLLKSVIDKDAPEMEYYFFQTGGGNFDMEELTDTHDNPWYQTVIKNRTSKITEPFFYDNINFGYLDSATQRQLDSGDVTYMFTMSVPIIMQNGSVIGAVTMDLHINSFKSIVENMKPFGQNGYAMLLSNEGTILVAPRAEMLGTLYSDIRYMKGLNPSDVVNAYRNTKTLYGEWRNTETKRDMGIVVASVEVSGKFPPMGLLLAFGIDDAYAATGLDHMLFMSRAVLVLIIVILFVIAIVIKRTIIANLNRFTDAIRNLTGGDRDLTNQIDIKTGDEFEVLAGHMNTFIAGIRSLIKEAKESTDDVASANNQLAATMEEMTATFANQSEQVSFVANNIGAINETSKNIAENLAQNTNKMEHTYESLKIGDKQLTTAVENINSIKDKNRSLGETVKNLVESSGKIGDILNVINDIAEQTNLLALNAAIEAARAGDAGRGFAVVADEVRKLAEKTTKSTNEISDIISTLRKDTESASSEMRNTTQSIDEGLDNIQKADAVFGEIVRINSEIYDSSQIINKNISEKFAMIHGVDDNTQTIATGIEESAQAVGEISKTVSHIQNMAENLKNMMGRFKTD